MNPSANEFRPTPYYDVNEIATYVEKTGDFPEVVADLRSTLEILTMQARGSGRTQMFVDTSSTAIHFRDDHVCVLPEVMACLAHYFGPTFGLLF